MLRYFLCVFVFILLTFNALASPITISIDALKQEVQNTYQDPAGNAYQLSMPLLLAANTKNKMLYQKILQKMQLQLASITKPAYKAWILGRVLLASQTIKDQKNVKIVLNEIIHLLSNKSALKNAFNAWARGYLAVYYSRKGDITYYKYWMNAANQLINKQRIPNLQNRLWAFVMNLEAAGGMHDKRAFESLVTMLLEQSQQKSVSASLSLLPNDAHGYQAWAISIVRCAAAEVRAKSLYSQLTQPLQLALQTSKDVNNRLLALAAIRMCSLGYCLQIASH